jgi:hypothetical protein
LYKSTAALLLVVPAKELFIFFTASVAQLHTGETTIAGRKRPECYSKPQLWVTNRYHDFVSE